MSPSTHDPSPLATRFQGLAVPMGGPTPDTSSLMARAHRRRRRRRVASAGAVIIAVGGITLRGIQLIEDPSGSASLVVAAETRAAAPDLHRSPAPVATTADLPSTEPAEVAPDHEPATSAAPENPEPTDGGETPRWAAGQLTPVLDDTVGGLISVEGTTLVHLRADGSVVRIDLPSAPAPASRQVTDVVVIDDIPLMLIGELAPAAGRGDEGEGDGHGRAAGAGYSTYREEATGDGVDQAGRTADGTGGFVRTIYAVDLINTEVHEVERRHIDDPGSSQWITNVHITAVDDHLVVVRDWWQSLCFGVEAITLDGATIPDFDSPAPPPSGDGIDAAALTRIHAGQIAPPTDCVGPERAGRGGADLVGHQADPAAIAAINEQLTDQPGS